MSRRKTKKGASDAPRGWRFGLVALRLWTGGFFLATAWWKLIESGSTVGQKIEAFRIEYVQMIGGAIANPPELFGMRLGFFADFLRGVMLPHAAWMAPLILAFEVVLGLSLVLGLGVRLTGSLGFLMMLAFTLAKPQPGAGADEPMGVFLFTVRSAN